MVAMGALLRSATVRLACDVSCRDDRSFSARIVGTAKLDVIDLVL